MQPPCQRTWLRPMLARPGARAIRICDGPLSPSRPQLLKSRYSPLACLTLAMHCIMQVRCNCSRRGKCTQQTRPHARNGARGIPGGPSV